VKKKNNPAIVLLSGGLDSCVTVGIAHRDYQLALLHVNYGQRTESRELEAFHSIASYYQVPDNMLLLANTDYLRQIGGSSLTDPNMQVQDAGQDIQGLPTSYVPFRNTLFLTIAVSWGEIIGAEKIFIGAVEQDIPGYPDCTPSYFRAFNNLIEAGTKPETHITVETPLIRKSKSEIVKTGFSINAPLHLSWSCYKKTEKACGTCLSCHLRLQAFKEAGYKDPIEYK